MYDKTVQMTPLREHLRRRRWSERVAASLAGVSRSTWRSLAAGTGNIELQSAASAASALDLGLVLLMLPGETRSECSTVAASYCVLRDGPASWKVHFMDLVDEFRRSLDPSLLLLPPPRELANELRALLAGIVVTLAEEAGIAPPRWAERRNVLPRPWFVAETESLKAMALLESPLAFRRHNIFVMNNFLSRA